MSRSSNLGELPNLDILRSLAVFLVVFQHFCNLWSVKTFGFFYVMSIGKLGVWLFFVHTSCVLMQSLERQSMEHGGGLFARFMVRRAFRIYPLSIAAVCYCAYTNSGAHLGIVLPAHSVTGFELATNLLLVQNLFGTPYIPAVLWTLPIEIQMYLFLPGLFLLARKTKSINIFLTISLVSVPIALLTPQSFLLLDVLHYVPFFIPGIIAWIAFKKLRFTLPSWSLAVMLIVAVLLFAALPFRPVGFFIALQIGLLLPAVKQVRTPSLCYGAKMIARYSYGIYLWHIIVIAAAARYFHSPATTVISALLFTALISIFTFHLIEDPAIKLGKRIADNLKSVRSAGYGADRDSKSLVAVP
jgi:peptidoglycan/LPS O-acetylase OafA/YrhL